jgi:hypothetical protein
MRALTFAALLSFSASARAEPRSVTGAYSNYELVAIRDAASRIDAVIDPAPEGKRIERIDFVRLDPIDAHDPLPTALDRVHATSREHVIRRALLVSEGQPYRTVLVDESARNLRRLRQLSLVVCVPMRGSAPDRVRLVVITKDVWSLYVDFDLAVTAGGLEALTLEPKETNLAGTHQIALGRFIVEPRTMTTGVAYEIPRLEGRWLSLAVEGNAVVARETADVEGGYGSAKVERPLFSSRTAWAWFTSTSFANRVRRRYVNAEVAMFEPEGSLPIPWSWRERRVVQDAAVTRSFGWEAKNDVTLGASFGHARYAVPHGPAESARAFARAAVPVGEDRVGPYVEWRSYRSDFLRTYDLATLGLQEDARLGYDLRLRAYPVLRGLGSTRDLFGAYGALSYGAALGDGLARAAVETTVEASRGEVTDGSVKGSFGIATPRFGPRVVASRLVLSITALSRFENYLNAKSFLGGESLLRGYPSRYVTGKDLVAANLEYRTRAYVLAGVQLGGALFFDAGDAMDGFDRLRPKASAGAGLRLVFAQLDRSVLRVDVGVPLAPDPRPADVPPLALFVGFHQAVGMP